MEQRIWLTVEEGMDTSGDFYANAYVGRSAQDAGEIASELIADMASAMEGYITRVLIQPEHGR